MNVCGMQTVISGPGEDICTGKLGKSKCRSDMNLTTKMAYSASDMLLQIENKLRGKEQSVFCIDSYCFVHICLL